MNSTKKTARIAGFLYLIMTVSGLFGVMYVPSKLLVRGDAAATAASILASSTLFNISVVNSLVATLLFSAAALVLFVLLKEVNKRLAVLMVILVLVQVPFSVQEVLNQLTAHELLRGEGYWSAFDQPQREALAMLFLDLGKHGPVIYALFWGLWLFPLGMLIFRSGFLPRFLGVWLIINGIAYVILSLTGILAPQYYDTVYTFGFPTFFGELVLALWLAIVGAKQNPPVENPSMK